MALISLVTASRRSLLARRFAAMPCTSHSIAAATQVRMPSEISPTRSDIPPRMTVRITSTVSRLKRLTEAAWAWLGLIIGCMVHLLLASYL